MSAHKGTTRGFRHSAALLAPQMRKVSESRGFAVGRVLTHWAEIAGEEIAAIARPVEVSYGRKGFGATLTVLTTGARAPMLEMQKETLRERVNAVYGYNAIARIRITQTAATGFAEGQAVFAPGPSARPEPIPDPAAERAAAEIAAPVADEGLRQALEALGRNVLSRRKS
ncbi:MAG: DciA family protein [Roseovarius sp.]|nr:DciA family protein [Roseovarius sp.]